MFCPKCGTLIGLDDLLFGGCCTYGCSKCHIAIYCYDPFTHELDEDTKPIMFNIFKVIFLKIKYKIRKE